MKRNNTHTPDYDESMAQIPLPSQSDVTAHRIALSEVFKRCFDRWGGMRYYIPGKAMPLPMETSPYQTNRLGPREDLLLAMHQAERLLILGEPGAGKTVALQRLAWELCGASEPAIPIFLALAGYSGGPLTAWVRDSLESTGHLQLESDAALHALLQSGTLRCFLLGDGLDELDPAHRDAAVAALTEWMEIYPHHPVILSSRPRSPVWRRLRDAMERVMILAHLSNEQIRTTLAAYLGRLGVTIHDALTPRQRLMARTPLNLWLMAEAGKASEPIPDTIAGLYHTFAMRKLRADLGVGEDVEITPPLNWRALADLAHTMGARRHCTPEAAVRIAARSLGGNTVLADAVIETCVRQGLLAVRQGLLAGRQQSPTLRRDERPQKSKTGKVLSGPKEKTLAFAPHPMMQAYFAARALHTVTDQEWSLNRWQRLKRKVKWLLTGQKSGLPALAADDVWWDPFVQLAGLTDRPDRLIEDVMHGNPWLALRCTEEAHRITRETLEAIQTRAVWHLDSEQVADRRRAVATLSHITLSRRRKAETVQPLLSAAADSDPEVAGLAVQTLVALGEDVRAQTLALARQPDHALHRAGLAYLTEILGIAVVWVPPGPFLMGSELAQDPQAYSDELHRHRVTLPGYWIGRYPVTVAQFRIFLAETGRGDAGHRLSGPDTHPMRLVAWHEARAYCRWLSERTGWSVTLPSEAEWEKAARGTDGRLYPWGNAPPNATLCNAGNRWGDTTPVGTYSPAGDSPYGCADMAGNVWEWTRSLYRDYPYDPDDGRENPESSGGWVLRGGAFSTLRAYVRCAYRFGVDPNDRYLDYGGFRIVVTPS